jgi:glycosyltransferase involved in cell wall biosynthesis
MFKFDELEDKRRHRISQFIDLCQRYVAKYMVISVEPLIFFIQIDLDTARLLHDYKFLFDSLNNRTAYFICSTCWYLERSENINEFNNLLERFKIDYPNFIFITLSNTIRQLDLFNENSIKTVFCNNNCFIDEKIFFPLPDTEKKYDAVYDARLVEWKRHHLASEIDSLGLIYYTIPWSEDNSYMNKIIRNFAQSRFFNHSETGECKKLTPPEVNQALNQCRVGLCLSAEEGAMYASIQYLLAGLPVVTTPSLGGREVFFDDEITIAVEPTPHSVRAGVKEIIKRNIPPALIRQKTLERIKEHREYFISLIQNIYQQEGVKRDFFLEWNNIFSNKLLRNLNHLETIEKLKSIS